MDFPSRVCLRLLLPGLLLLLACTRVAAQQDSHTIIVLDLGMPAESIARASELSRGLAERAPVEHRLALIGADEIVHHLIEPASGQAFGVQFDAIASELSAREFSSYSSGLERAVALARETGAPSTLLLFSDGRISASNASRNDRYQQWAHSILLPDAASIGMRVVVASPTPLPDSLTSALQLASPNNTGIDLNATDADALTQMLFAADATLAASESATQQAAEQALAERRAADEAAEQALAEQRAADARAAEQALAEQRAADEAAEQALAEQRAADARAAEQALAEQRAADEAAEQALAEQRAADEAAEQALAVQRAADRLAEQQAQQQATEPAASTPSISITATPVESGDSNAWLAMLGAVIALLLGGAGGWWFLRRRGGGSPPAEHERQRSERQAAYSQARNSGDETIVRDAPGGAATAKLSVTTSAPDVATMVNPHTASAPVADEATSINTDSHAFRDLSDDDDDTKEVATALVTAASPDEPTIETGKLPENTEEAAGFPAAPPPNPADEFAVFENSINAKRATGQESEEQRRRESREALSRDRTHDKTFDPALDVDK